MPVINSIEEIALTAGGGTKNLLTTSGVSLYIITGTATLTSSWTIQPSGTPTIGMTYSFLYKANINLNGENITIFGETLPENLSNKEFKIEAVWNGTAWIVSFLADVSEDGIIPLGSIQNNEYKLMPSVSETMINGDDSPVIVNAVQAEGTTDSELYYKVNANEKVIKIVGRITLKDVDETVVSGTLKVNLMSWVGYDLYPSLGGAIQHNIPIQLMYRPTTTSPVDYIEVKGGFLQKSPTFSAIKLVVPVSNIGTDVNARYEGIVNLELQYT